MQPTSLLTLGVGVAALALMTACGPATQFFADTAEVDSGDDGSALVQLRGTMPAALVRIDGYLEIDDLDLCGPENGDANLCSAGTVLDPVCPVAGDPADNARFPGPQTGDPENPGDVTWVDWADLGDGPPYFLRDPGTHDGIPDDIFKQKSCVDFGNNPSKADIDLVGVAANKTWMYLLSERETTQGQEEWHYFFTKHPPVLATTAECAAPTWHWTLEDRDVQVVVRFQSTSGLPDGTVSVLWWKDKDGDPSNDTGVLAQDLIQHANWEHPSHDVFPEPMEPSYSAFNIAPGPKSRDADVEFDLDGAPLASGQKAETAIDLVNVFGPGCGLSRVMTIITSASGSGGMTDDLKDFFGPVAVETGALLATLEVDSACEEAFTYKVRAYEGLVDEAHELTLPHDELEVELAWDCDGDGVYNTRLDPTGEGRVEVPIDQETPCDVVATVRGVAGGLYHACDGSTRVDDHLVFADLEATASLSGTCTGAWGWEANPKHGQAPYDYDWTFTPDAGDTIDPTSSTAASGNGTAAGLDPTGINAAVVVRDARGCQVAKLADTVTYAPMALGVQAFPVGDECVDTAAFSTQVQGGTGHYRVTWDGQGVDVLNCPSPSVFDESEDGLLRKLCDLGLPGGHCFSGQVLVHAEDALGICPAPPDRTLVADRTSDLTVAVLP